MLLHNKNILSLPSCLLLSCNRPLAYLPWLIQKTGLRRMPHPLVGTTHVTLPHRSGAWEPLGTSRGSHDPTTYSHHLQGKGHTGGSRGLAGSSVGFQQVQWPRCHLASLTAFLCSFRLEVGLAKQRLPRFNKRYHLSNQPTARSQPQCDGKHPGSYQQHL